MTNLYAYMRKFYENEIESTAKFIDIITLPGQQKKKQQTDFYLYIYTRFVMICGKLYYLKFTI